jgi:3-oxoacyl-[acyl-carrier protein] reductase
VINLSGKSEPDSLLAATPAKAAIHGWSKGLSREVGKHGITVNCLAPGRIMSEQIRRKYSPEFRAHEEQHEIPVGRYGEPGEIAAMAVFLASPRGSYVTGTVIPVDGGMRRYAFQPGPAGAPARRNRAPLSTAWSAMLLYGPERHLLDCDSTFCRQSCSLQ